MSESGDGRTSGYSGFLRGDFRNSETSGFEGGGDFCGGFENAPELSSIHYQCFNNLLVVYSNHT